MSTSTQRQVMTSTTCRYPVGCSRSARTRGLCHSHYVRMASAGKIQTTMLPASPVAALAREHLARGYTLHGLAAATAIDPGALGNLTSGLTTTVRRSTLAAITALPLPPTLIGTQRRLHALARLGWPPSHIATHAGLSPSALRNATYRNRYTPAVRFAIASAFERLRGTPGPSRATARAAATRGYPTALAWHADIDDPRATPDPRFHQSPHQSQEVVSHA